MVDNWTEIKNVMLKHGWCDTQTLIKETNVLHSTIHRILRSQIKRDVVEREFRHYTTNRTSMIGDAKRYKFFWRLKQ